MSGNAPPLAPQGSSWAGLACADTPHMVSTGALHWDHHRLSGVCCECTPGFFHGRLKHTSRHRSNSPCGMMGLGAQMLAGWATLARPQFRQGPRESCGWVAEPAQTASSGSTSLLPDVQVTCLAALEHCVPKRTGQSPHTESSALPLLSPLNETFFHGPTMLMQLTGCKVHD